MSLVNLSTMFVVIVLCALHGAFASQLPVQPKLVKLLLEQPGPLLVAASATPNTPPMSTPSMIDFVNGNFTHPSVIAADCFNAMGDSLVKKCQDKAMKDWDPSKMNTATSTTWETCCALFEELDCYVHLAKDFCPAATQQALIAYSQKVAYYFHGIICMSVSFTDWQTSCNATVQAQKAKDHQKALDDNSSLKPEFVSLPKDDGPESACFNKLRTHNKTNIEKKCQDDSLYKWDPARRKFLESAILESCCSIYDTLDCVEREAKNVCTDAEIDDMARYRKNSLIALGAETCKNVKYDQYNKLCANSTTILIGSPSAAFAALPSILTLVSVLLVHLRVNY